MRRKEELATGEVYHVFNKSIADFKIFNNDNEFSRIINTIRYYQIKGNLVKFSRFIESTEVKQSGFSEYFISVAQEKEKIVQIIAYCIMPTHLHLILKQLKKNGISIFMGNVLNSYSRYFNTKYKRKGPLWQGKFQNVLVDRDEYLLHLTRYIHLNPVTAYLVDAPEKWSASSYGEYISQDTHSNNRICEYADILDIKASSYKEFVEDRISYQRELANIKGLILE